VQIFLFSNLLTKNLRIKINRTIVLPVVLYRFQTWSLTLSKKRRLIMFESRVPRRIFRSNSDEVKGAEKSTK
jgi:hypothetical protein